MGTAKAKLQRALEHVQDVMDSGEFESSPDVLTAACEAREAVAKALTKVKVREPVHLRLSPARRLVDALELANQIDAIILALRDEAPELGHGEHMVKARVHLLEALSALARARDAASSMGPTDDGVMACGSGTYTPDITGLPGVSGRYESGTYSMRFPIIDLWKRSPPPRPKATEMRSEAPTDDSQQARLAAMLARARELSEGLRMAARSGEALVQAVERLEAAAQKAGRPVAQSCPCGCHSTTTRGLGPNAHCLACAPAPKQEGR